MKIATFLVLAKSDDLIQAGQAMDMCDSIASLDVAKATIAPNSTDTMRKEKIFHIFSIFISRNTRELLVVFDNHVVHVYFCMPLLC